MMMRDAAASGSLGEMLAVLVVAEWSYQSWGERVQAAGVRVCKWLVENGADYDCD